MAFMLDRLEALTWARAGELAASETPLWAVERERERERPGERMCAKQWGGRGRQMLPFSSLQQEGVDKKGWGSPNTSPPVIESLEVRLPDL